ncbi:MAG: TonB-dependent receptor plug domain-containing protein [Burkholderiales bacterium]|jgi:iron complex outermembrane receptor protein|nr:TonB-dependent receptor [Betaproteobacteria bacterium]
MRNNKLRIMCAALGSVGLLTQIGVNAQTTPAPAKVEKFEVTGSLIKRTDAETPSLVQVITAEDIKNSGYATVEELLRSLGAVDASSVQDGAASGFVGGLATISLRGFGSQGTLILINGRRIAPVAAVDVNFGRGSLLSVNTIPREAIERIEILKDGASALYGSDAMAGVINYILKKDYKGAEASVSYGANDQGVGVTKSASITFGFGDIATQRFNVFGGIQVSRRDPVMHSELKDRGNLDLYNEYLRVNGSLARFTADSVASNVASYYRVPASIAGSTVIDGRTVANNSVFGANYLGTFAGCPPELTVGQGVPTRLSNFAATTASLRVGQCRFNLDNADEAIGKQNRESATVRANFALSNELTAYADVMLARTTTTEKAVPRTLTTGLVSSANPVATTWPLLSGVFLSQNALILPVGHPDNPTNGTATAQPVQLIYRFSDLPLNDINELKTLRVTSGVQGSIGAWDIDTAVLYSRQDNSRVQEARLRKSLLDRSLAAGTYRFTQPNTAAGLASVASDAVNEGKATVAALDIRGSRELWSMAGGKAAVAVGAEARRETLSSVPSDIYKTGDFIGLVANGAEGSRSSQAGFAELRLPVAKTLEVQTALRFEKYSDFGNSTTGKLGFKWDAVPGGVALRGTAATGFRAPSISQIGDSFLLSFNNSQERRVFDSLRCNSSNPAAPVSRADPPVARDCNVTNFTAVPAGTATPGNLPTIIAANRNLKPEKSNSYTFGTILQPFKNVDLAIDFWRFIRNDEVRVQRGIDIIDAYNANPSANGGPLIRDPNPATWLPGIPNSGPILVVQRQYGNFNFTKTAGIDYDFNIRFPSTDIGRFTLNVNGTVTRYFDQQILSGSPVQVLVGTTTADVPKHKGSATVRWNRGGWSSWARFNHTSALERTTTATCTAAGASAGNTFLQANGGCHIGAERNFDIGGAYTGFKGLTVSLALLNVENDYGRSQDIPSTFTYWENGTTGQLGRRFNLNVGYKFK